MRPYRCSEIFDYNYAGPAVSSSESLFIEDLLDYFHNDIQVVFLSDLTTASDRLFTKHFIHSQTLMDVTIERTSKAHGMTWECQLYITLHDNPIIQLDIMLDILMKLEQPGPVVAEKIKQVNIPDYSVNNTTFGICRSRDD